ncbi:MAG: stage III sporulation protein AD [Faecalimonas sp.]|nr:stage III sporulation protein AD [Faecalimonas sp.]
MNIVQIGVLGIVGALLAIQLRQYKAEFSIYLCIGISLLVFFGVFEYLETILDTVRELAASLKMNHKYLTTLLKMLGVTYVAEFSSNICKDAGYQTIATQIEIFSKLTILVLSLPILVALLQTIQDFLR